YTATSLQTLGIFDFNPLQKPLQAATRAATGCLSVFRIARCPRLFHNLTMSLCRRLLGVGLLVFLSASQTSFAQVSKGNWILLNRGLQLQGMCTKDDYFHLTTYSNANYTSINWLWDSDTSKMGTAPGFPWARWVGTNSPTEIPPLAGETAYMSQLVTLQL